MKTFNIDADNNITVFASKKEAAAASATPFDPFACQSELAELAAAWPASRLIDIWNSIPGVTAVSKFTNRKVATERIWKAIQNLGVPPKPAADATKQVEAAPADVPIASSSVEPASETAEPVITEVQSPAATVAPPAQQEVVDGVVLAAEPELAAESKLAPTEWVADAAAQGADLAPVAADPATEPTPAKKRAKAPKRAAEPKASIREGSKTAKILALIERPEGATLAELMEAAAWQAHSVRGFISGTMAKKMRLTVKSAKREDGVRVYSISR